LGNIQASFLGTEKISEKKLFQKDEKSKEQSNNPEGSG